LNADNVEQVIDIIELCCQVIDTVIRNASREYRCRYTKTTPDDALSELNDRFKEHGIGYQYENGSIIRVDCTVMHTEVTKPTLQLLNNNKFQGANEEYLKAHDHYRHGRNRECLTFCGRAFESTMKTICKEKSWQFDETKDAAQKLIDICIEKMTLPSFFSSVLIGAATIRNKLGGHGQGQTRQPVDDEIARYCLNLTGANIIFLVEKSSIK